MELGRSEAIQQHHHHSVEGPSREETAEGLIGRMQADLGWISEAASHAKTWVFISQQWWSWGFYLRRDSNVSSAWIDHASNPNLKEGKWAHLPHRQSWHVCCGPDLVWALLQLQDPASEDPEIQPASLSESPWWRPVQKDARGERHHLEPYGPRS